MSSVDAPALKHHDMNMYREVEIEFHVPAD
jgi:hypothetical protein